MSHSTYNSHVRDADRTLKAITNTYINTLTTTHKCINCHWLVVDRHWVTEVINSTASCRTFAVSQMFAVSLWSMNVTMQQADTSSITTGMWRKLVCSCGDGGMSFRMMTWRVQRPMGVWRVVDICQNEHFLRSRVWPRQHALLVNAAERLSTHNTTYINQFFFFLCMQLRPIVGQPGNSSIISRVKLRQTTVQLGKRAGFDDVGHRLGLTTGAQICNSF